MSLRFHWRMIHRGETAGVPRGTQNLLSMSQPDLVAQAEFCRRALASGTSRSYWTSASPSRTRSLLAAALACSKSTTSSSSSPSGPA